MCGICGQIRYDGEPVSSELLKKMADSISHRGPDGEGFFRADGVGLAHRRLSIIDLSNAASQPMTNEDGSLWLVLNGEIYNYIELRDELLAAGHTFHSNTDSEVVLHGYEQWGEQCLERFNGMWAFAIYDKKDGSVFFARDRFGIKPFHYFEIDGRFTFASEIKAILVAEPQAAQPNHHCLGRFFAYGLFDDGEETFFTDIRRLPPAHCARLKDGALRIKKYWDLDLDAARERYDYSDPERTLRELLTDSVRLRLRSDVPVGTCLSGGLDSSTIVSIADKFFSTSINTFSSLYEQASCDESRFVDAMNSRCDTIPHPVRPEPDGFFDILRKITWHQDEPSAGPGLYSQWHVMQKAAGVVKVLLDGQGGDEILAGYFPFYRYYAGSILRDALRKFSPALLGKFFRENKNIRQYYPAHRPIIAVLDTITPRFVHRLYKKIKLLRGPRLQSADVLSSDFAASMRTITPPMQYTRDLGSPLDNILYEQLTRSSIPALLRYEDRNSMAFSIEARTPFLDYRVVEFCLALPYHAKIRDGITKSVLREAMRGILPDEIVDRRDKMGYPTPVADWFRHELRDGVRDILLSKRCIERGIFSREGLESILSLHESGARNASLEIYRLLSTELWFEEFIDERN